MPAEAYRGVQLDEHDGGAVTLRPVTGEAMRAFHHAWDLVPMEERPAAFVLRGSLAEARAVVDRVLDGGAKLYVDEGGHQVLEE
jgi:hypothetical protein